MTMTKCMEDIWSQEPVIIIIECIVVVALHWLVFVGLVFFLQKKRMAIIYYYILYMANTRRRRKSSMLNEKEVLSFNLAAFQNDNLFLISQELIFARSLKKDFFT